VLKYFILYRISYLNGKYHVIDLRSLHKIGTLKDKRVVIYTAVIRSLLYVHVESTISHNFLLTVHDDDFSNAGQ
jgi:hypothetical protein